MRCLCRSAQTVLRCGTCDGGRLPKVEDMLRLLSLEKCADTYIGSQVGSMDALPAASQMARLVVARLAAY